MSYVATLNDGKRELLRIPCRRLLDAKLAAQTWLREARRYGKLAATVTVIPSDIATREDDESRRVFFLQHGRIKQEAF